MRGRISPAGPMKLLNDHYSWHVLERLTKSQVFLWNDNLLYTLPDSDFKQSKHQFILIGDNLFPFKITKL